MDSHITSNVTAETAVQLYFLNIVDLEMAFDMYPEVKLKLWKNCAVKIVLNILAEHKDFQVNIYCIPSVCDLKCLELCVFSHMGQLSCSLGICTICNM